jgi:hypothetical protein
VCDTQGDNYDNPSQVNYSMRGKRGILFYSSLFTLYGERNKRSPSLNWRSNIFVKINHMD